MRITVVGRTHRLCHLTGALRAEGVECDTFVTREHYARAYGGLLNPAPRLWSPGAYAPAEGLLVTDDPEVTAWADRAGVPVLGRWPGSGHEQSPLGFAVWWDGVSWSCPHWSIIEMGAQHGGLGRHIPTSVALAHAKVTPEFVESVLTKHVPPGVRGLVRAELVRAPEGGAPAPGALRFGWPDLHHQLLFASQPSAAQALARGPALLPGVVYFGTVLSVPPWPNPPTKASRRYVIAEVPGPPAGLVWHDVMMDRKMTTAGLDGLVALSVASARFLTTAKHVVMGSAQALGISELQVRTDCGETISQWLSRLELLGLLT